MNHRKHNRRALSMAVIMVLALVLFGTLKINQQRIRIQDLESACLAQMDVIGRMSMDLEREAIEQER